MKLAVTQPNDAAAWDAFTCSATSPQEFLQSWAWGEFQAAAGKGIERLALSRDGTIHAVALVVPHTTRLGKSFWLVPRGPIISPSLAADEQHQVWTALLQELDRRRPATTMFLKVEPNLAPPSDVGLVKGTGMHPAQTLLLDLTLSEEQLLGGMHQKTRYNIHLSERHGVTVRFGRAETDVDDFLRLLRATARRQSIGVFPDDYYRTMVASLGAMIEVAVASHRDQPLAAALVVRFGETSTYLHGASADERQELMASHLMQWRIIQRVKRNGSRIYDFFGIAPEGEADHRWAGITRFKKGFGGSVHVYPGAFNRIYQRSWFLAYRLAKKIVGR
ncbi:MAG: peptidoglycan bridge formation glycyltransferase FemA/FemB family protein [Candidatus Kerfeldbacteria bacterium]|nr:peptidoglycan bridge formation glycyltransferase FemA/FemB family protein [Candidatus Kerfeldbacteria bacterium]